MNIEERPWGTFEVLLDVSNCKVKRITIKPGQSPSYQYHLKREERWIIIQGRGEAVLDGMPVLVTTGGIIHVARQMKHRIRNTGTEDLVFIEVQMGEYFGEDDIVRISDDYGRI